MWTILFFLLICLSLGSIPLTGWVVKRLSGKNLTQVGTGNVSVSAAFSQGGIVTGIAAVVIEILRGIIPIVLARWGFSQLPAWGLIGLITLVAGRYCFGKGGGVTNVTWGFLLYAPIVALTTGLTGYLIWQLSRFNSTLTASQARLRGVRWGVLTGPIWLGLWHHIQQQPISVVELMAATALAVELLWINLRQDDDWELSMKQGLLSLNHKLEVHRCGEKAARLSQLKRAGFHVLPGWVLPPATSGDIAIPESSFPVIVRSSAVGEDSEMNSAAGQYQTIGPVYHPQELPAAIEQCRQSYYQEAAVNYRRQRQLPEAGMAVLIQPYLQGEVSGVMFSRNPLDGGAKVTIEALPGNAETVVGGQTTPVHLEVEINHPEANISCEILPPTVITELVQQAQKIEAFYHGIPQDIEWSWDGKKIWILQSRPITNLRPIWTRTIAAEVIPGVIPPLTWSINRPLTCGVWGEIFTVVLGKRAADLDFKETATLLGSHAYFNATLLGEIFRMMGLPEQGLEFLLRGQKMGKPPLSKVSSSLPGLWRLVQRERKLVEEFKRDEQQLFNLALEQLNQEYQTQILNSNALSLPQLLERAERIQQLLKPATYYNILGPIGLAIRQAIFRVPQDWLPTQEAPEVASMKALQELATQFRQIHLQRQQDLKQVFEQNQGIQNQFHNWLDTYGYLSEVGTDIAVPTWREQAEIFKNLLLNLAQNESSNLQKSAAQALNFWQKWRLSRCEQQALIKGKIATVYGQLLAHLRWTFLAIEHLGVTRGILSQPGDIFYLKYSEIQQWIQNDYSDSLIAKVNQRRQQFEQDKTRTVPAVVYGNLLPQLSTTGETKQNLAQNITGIPASVGCVEGIVKVCPNLGVDLTNHEKLILVVPYTDAGWAPLLLTAKAIISEVGGQLSHGAIIAREYQIPAVMNIPNAMTYFKDGQRVKVDGYQGTVELLES
jgi:phosphoenolpyruvate synthase/pyruvate phosphate dikinase/glycerol-3-phosphate acyltransferase PlsY